MLEAQMVKMAVGLTKHVSGNRKKWVCGNITLGQIFLLLFPFSCPHSLLFPTAMCSFSGLHSHFLSCREN
jgi:hypothetical protein